MVRVASGSVVEGTDEKFYGTTYQGTATGYGTVFEVLPQELLRRFTVLPHDNCSDGRIRLEGCFKPLTGSFTALQMRAARATTALFSVWILV